MTILWHEFKHPMAYHDDAGTWVITRIRPGLWELYHLERRALIGYFETLEGAKRKAEDYDG